ncbi:MAG: YibE/F family protein [Chloroflexi bacterium]|nr:YibE/F family protein [Chloroflexota bacterium]
MRIGTGSGAFRLCLLSLLLLGLGVMTPVWAEGAEEPEQHGEVLEAVVGYVQEEQEIEVMGQRQLYQRLELIVVSGPRRGERIVVENGAIPEAHPRRYRAGERVFVRAFENGSTTAYVLDSPSRWMPLIGIVGIFVLVVALVSRWRSVPALFGLGLSFAVLFVFVLPQLSAGAPPLRTILIGGALIVPLTFYLAHGVSLKTTIAVVGTALALALTVLLAQGFVHLTDLSGYASEEAGFLQAQNPGALNIRGLLVAGIVVGVLGVLDDVTISQAAVVQQLHRANSQLSSRELFTRAMRVGQDHIASVVNTLALVYAGAALPLLLLLRTSPLPWRYLLSQEIIAEEIVRMMVASIGLMTAVPITTFLAAEAMTLAARWLALDQGPRPDTF